MGIRRCWRRQVQGCFHMLSLLADVDGVALLVALFARHVLERAVLLHATGLPTAFAKAIVGTGSRSF